MRGLPWPSNADKVRFIIGGENYSAQQGTIEFDYLSYSNTSGVLSNTANWSTTSGGPSGASIPGAGNRAIFDGADGNNGSCQMDCDVNVKSIILGSSYFGNVNLQNYSISVGNGGIIMEGGGLSGKTSMLTVSGDMLITGGTYKSSSAQTQVTGNINIASGSIDVKQGTLLLNGSADQILSSPASSYYQRILLNKTSYLYLASDLPVLDSLELSSGGIVSGSYLVSVGQSAINPGKIVANSGWINGKIKKWFTTTEAIYFPFGSANFKSPLTLTILTTPVTPGTITLSYMDVGSLTTPVYFSDGTAPILWRSRSSWPMVTNDLSGGSYHLTASNNTLGYVGDIADLHLVLENSVVGTHEPTSGSTANPILKRAGLTLADLSNTYYMGSSSYVLPIKWLQFSAKQLQDKKVQINWRTTATQVTSYELERSNDGNHFYSVTRVTSKGIGQQDYNYIDTATVGKQYYRVRATTNNTKTETSFIIGICLSNETTPAIKLVDNNNEIELELPEPKPSILILTDVQGKIVKQYKATGQLVKLQIQNFPKGLYFLNVFNGSSRATFKVIMK